MTPNEALEVAHRRATKYWHMGLMIYGHEALVRYGFTDGHMIDFVRDIRNQVTDEALESARTSLTKEELVEKLQKLKEEWKA